jgi:hypothetical protein
MSKNTKFCNSCKKERLINEFCKDKSKRDGLRSQCKKCSLQYAKQYLQNHKEQKQQYLKNYYQCKKLLYKQYNQEHREQRNQYQKNKFRTDVSFKIAFCLRIRLNQVLKGNYKSQSIVELLGCSIEQLKQHLESKFTNGMSFSNYGLWHIDHIRPCSNFDLSLESEQRKCFHYLNLQPLWAVDNLKKGKTVL